MYNYQEKSLLIEVFKICISVIITDALSMQKLAEIPGRQGYDQYRHSSHFMHLLVMFVVLKN